MRSPLWLIPIVLVGLSGRTPAPPLESPRPTGIAAAPITVRDGFARFRVPPHGDGQLVFVVSSLAVNPEPSTVSLSVASPGNRHTRPTSLPLLAIHRYRNRRQPAAPPVNQVVQTSVELPASQQRRIFDVPLLNGLPAHKGGCVRVVARTAAVGSRCTVYLDEATGPDVRHMALATAVVSYLESTIMPLGDHLIGPPADIDNDGKLAILLTPRLGTLQRNRTTVGGFVRAADFRPNLERPHSNQADMIYLNSSLVPGLGLGDVLAHEYRHVLTCSHRDALGHPSEEDWINEALAHLAEPGPTNIMHRIRTYLAAPSRYPLVVPDYYQAGLWRCDGVRGATFLFLDWCMGQHGDHLAGRLLRSRHSGITNIERNTHERFSALFRDWSVAMLHGGVPFHPGGPRVLTWSGNAPLHLDLVGTATAYIAPGRLKPGTVVHVRAPSRTRLQVTATLRSTTD
jgi:hypothetical protein